MHLKTKPNLKNYFSTDGSQNILTILVLQFLKSFPLIAYSTSPLSVVQGENWALACPARILNLGWKWRQGHSHAHGQVLIGEPGTIFSFNYVYYVSLIFSLWRKLPHSCMWSETWSRCAGLLSSDLVKLSQRPFGARKWQGQFFHTALSGPLLPICTFRATSAWRSSCIWRIPAFAHLNCCVTSFENPLTSMIRNGFWMNMVSCCPKLKLSKRLLKFSISLPKSTKEDTSLCPWTCACTALKCAQSSCRSSLNTSRFHWKERTAVISSQIEVSLPCSFKFS